jgi:fructose transport system substrate-binding protein
VHPVPSQASGIFISYRRRDTSFPAGWLYERLISHFGETHIFKDVDSIQPGDDFVEVITRSVLACHTMLVLIGPSWQVGTPVRDLPEAESTDFVQLEVETALLNGLRIIPILVEDAKMPAERDLPPSMASLARRNAVVLNPNHFDASFKRLLPVLEQARRDAEQRREAQLQAARDAEERREAQLRAARDAEERRETQLRAARDAEQRREAELRAARPADPVPPIRPAPAPRTVPTGRGGASVRNNIDVKPPAVDPKRADTKRFSTGWAVGALVTVAVIVLVTIITLPGSGTNSPSGTGTSTGPGGAVKTIVGLITKTDTNPFFVKMKEGAQQAAEAAGVTLQSYAGRTDGDNEAQVEAIENLISAGAKGILITAADSKAIVPEINKARQAGILVIALDTPTDPPDAVDAVFATDQFQAGFVIGQWARAKAGASASRAKIAMLDLNANQLSVDVQRDQGFLSGFGVDVGDLTKIGDETDPRVVGHDVTDGAEEGGRTAMENLLQKDPGITIVYTINEPAAAGAYQALKAAGKDKAVTIVSIDGGCPGVQAVKAGQLGATAQQLPLRMAQQGVAAVVAFTKDGTKPQVTVGKNFTDIGVALVTEQAKPGIYSQDTTFGLQNCWG